MEPSAWQAGGKVCRYLASAAWLLTPAASRVHISPSQTGFKTGPLVGMQLCLFYPHLDRYLLESESLVWHDFREVFCSRVTLLIQYRVLFNFMAIAL